MKSKKLAILWDFDGTLFDTYPVYTRIFKKILKDETTTESEIFSQLKVSFRHAWNYFNLTDAQVNEFLQLDERISPNEMKPFDGVEEILKDARTNVIMTHKLRKEVEHILHYYGWEGYFSDIVTGDDGFPRKPDPQSYQYLHEKYQLDLVIGDREIDIIPANQLGISSCLFQNKKSNLATYYIDNYQDFFKIIERGNG